MDKNTNSAEALPPMDPTPSPKAPKPSIGRRIWRVTRNFLIGLFSFLLLLIIAIQLPFVQTWLGHQVAAWLSKKLEVKVEIGKLEIDFFDRVTLKEVYWEDEHQKPTIVADEVTVILDELALNESRIVFSDVIVRRGEINFIKYKGENKLNFIKLIDKFKSPNPAPKDTTQKPLQLMALSITIEDTDFRLCNEMGPETTADFKPSDLRIRGISGDFTNFSIVGDSLAFNVDFLRAFEGSGLKIKEMKARTVISRSEISFRNFSIKTNRSHLSGYYAMKFSGFEDFSDFTNKVNLLAELNLSNIDMADIAYFAPALKGMDLNFRIKGAIKGTLSNLKARDLKLYFGSVTQLNGKLDMTGLPDIKNTFIFFDLEKLVTDYYDLQMIPLPPFDEGKKLAIPAELKRLGVLKFKGNFTGFIRDFTAYGNLQTQLGSARTDIHLSQDTLRKTTSYTGNVAVTDFDLGKLLDQPQTFGKVTLAANINGRGFDAKTADADFDGTIQNFDLNGYSYRNVEVNAGFKTGKFVGNLNLNDPNAHLDFDGIIDFSSPTPVFNFTAAIKETDLGKINLIKTDSAALVSTDMVINFSGKSVDDFIGNINFSNTQFKQGTRNYTLKSLIVSAQAVDTNKIIEIASDYVDADFSGYIKFIPLWNEIKTRINLVSPSAGLTVDEKMEKAPQNFAYNIHLKNTKAITEIFVPELQINPNSIVYGSYNSIENDVTLSGKSSGIKFKNFAVKNWYLNAETQGDLLDVQTGSSRFYLSDSLFIENTRLTTKLLNDSLKFWVGFMNNGTKRNGVSLNGATFIGDVPHLEIALTNTNFYFQDTLWTLNNQNKIVIDSSYLRIEDIQIRKGSVEEPMLVINGETSKELDRPLRVMLNDFPLDFFNFFFAGSGVKIDGIADGKVELYNLFSTPYFSSDLSMETLRLNGIELGDLNVRSRYDQVTRGITLFTKLQQEGKVTLSIEDGHFYPFQKEDQLDLAIDINELNLAAFGKFVAPVFSDLRGLAKGKVVLKGTAKEPELSAKLNLRNGGIKVAFLNAFFNLEMEQDIFIDNRIIKLQTITLRDRFGKTGKLKGAITHNLFKDIALDLEFLEARNLCVMETNARMNEQFYGSAFVTIPPGKSSSIRGPINNLVVDANVRTEKGTIINIPISSSSEISKDGFVTFISNKKDTTQSQTLQTTTKPKEEGNFTVDLKVDVTPDAIFKVVFDETVGDVLTASGKSPNIRLLIDTKDKFEMYGNFEITRGDYLFTLQNLVNKQFVIKPGSSVVWSGSPFNATINATAIYPANAPLSPIVSSFMNGTDAERFKRASKIYCELNLTNRLINPQISFNLQLPNEDEATRNIVRSVLSSEEEMNRQVFALLVLNSFLPPESFTGNNGLGQNMFANVVGTSTVELLSGQLNNWLSKLTKDVNVNVKYKQGDKDYATQVSVALSTQLFDQRVIVDGDLGVGVQRVSNTDNTQNQIVGNVNVEVKITDDGKLRVKAFNRSNENNLLKNSVPYTQGIGITYRREFDSWKEVFRKRTKEERDARKNAKKNKNLPPPPVQQQDDPDFLQDWINGTDSKGTPPPDTDDNSTPNQSPDNQNLPSNMIEFGPE